MNCEHFTHIVDTMEVDQLTDAQRRQVESHASTCSRCAANWSVHAALAGESLAPMPAALADRCRKTWASSPAVRPRRTGRRLTLLGSAVALVVAAAALVVWTSRHSEIDPAVPPLAQAPTVAPAVIEPLLPARMVTEVPELSPQPAAVEPPPDAGLPLLPRPASSGQQRSRIAFEKALEMFPELTEGPVRDGYFVIGMVMRPDGSVLSHVIRHATPEDLQQVVSEVELSVPRDGDGRGSSTRSRRTSLPDGRTLRADIMVLHALVDENYDITRSDVRVRQIVGGRFTGLMQPRDSEALNRVVVLLSEDGTIRREFVERVPVASAGSGSAPDSASLMRIAERFAEQMEVEPDQIGLMGNTVLEKHGESGAQILMVRYAWQRRSTEDGPSLGQTSAATRAPRINAADALLVVKHVLPDAFTHQDASIGAPTIVLTAEGRVIQAGWVRTEAGRPIADTLKEQLVPGVETGYFSGVTLTDENGVTARVSLAWENPKAPQER